MTPIVLVHGFPFDGRMWQAQADFLRSPEGGGHRVLTPDLAGFGVSPDPAPTREKATIEHYAESLHAFIRQQAGGKAIVGGFSMGGYVLLALLRQYPAAAAAAMFIDTRPDADSAETRATRIKSIEDVETNGTSALLETLVARLLSKKATSAIRQQTRALMEQQSAKAIIAAQSAMAKRRDQSDLLADLEIPALILVGAEDAVTPPSVAVAMQSHMPHAMLVQIVSAGHMAAVEQPDAVNAAIKAFLATIKEH